MKDTGREIKIQTVSKYYFKYGCVDNRILKFDDQVDQNVNYNQRKHFFWLSRTRLIVSVEAYYLYSQYECGLQTCILS